MATVVNNDLTRGLRGRIGKWLVFRTFRGKTVVGHAPRKPDPLKQSAAQRQTRSTFREAAAWAVRILLDPGQKRYFTQLAKKQALPNAYTAALRDYMRGVAAKRVVEQTEHSVDKKEKFNVSRGQAFKASRKSVFRNTSTRPYDSLFRHKSSLNMHIAYSGLKETCQISRVRLLLYNQSRENGVKLLLHSDVVPGCCQNVKLREILRMLVRNNTPAAPKEG